MGFELASSCFQTAALPIDLFGLAGNKMLVESHATACLRYSSDNRTIVHADVRCFDCISEAFTAWSVEQFYDQPCREIFSRYREYGSKLERPCMVQDMKVWETIFTCILHPFFSQEISIKIWWPCVRVLRFFEKTRPTPIMDKPER